MNTAAAETSSLTNITKVLRIDKVIFYNSPLPFCIDTVIDIEKVSDTFKFNLFGIHLNPIQRIVNGKQRLVSFSFNIGTGYHIWELIIGFHNKQSKLNLWHDDSIGELVHPELQADRDILQDYFRKYLHSDSYTSGLPWTVAGYSREVLDDYRTSHEYRELRFIKLLTNGFTVGNSKAIQAV